MEAKSHSKSKKTIGDEPPSLQKTKEYENKIKIDSEIFKEYNNCLLCFIFLI